MARPTEVELQLLEKITEDRLLTSLKNIREVVEDIWADDAPHIIQDFTDYGIKHSERLANFAYRLLEANDGRPLNSQEMYLLISGIYLHDIGMQCDLVKFPEIQKKAQEFGAKFDIPFSAKESSAA